MTFLNYIQHVSQTHIAGHLSPKSRPATPLPSEPVTPIEPEPPLLPAPTTTESVPDAFVDAPTDPIEAEPIAALTPLPTPAPAPAPAPDSDVHTAVEPADIAEPVAAPVDVPATITEEQPTTAAAPATEQVVLAAPVELAKPDEAKEADVPVAEPAVAEATEVKPLIDDAHKQPTTTHAESGTLHTPGEVATQVDGTPAEKPVEEEPAAAAANGPTEAKEEKKEEKKVSAKEKVEKTKAEGKGFFAKLFGSKDKSPKKEKKVKTPKTEQTDPLAATETPATASGPVAEIKADDSHKPEVTGVALAAEPVTAEPVTAIEDAPVASTSAAPVETEAVKETENTSAPTEPVVEAKADETVDKDMKAAKAHRRLSTRFTSFVKGIGKKDHKDEATKDTAEPAAASEPTPVVSDEAPKIAEPAPSEPIRIDEKKPTTTVAPPVAPAVAAAA